MTRDLTSNPDAVADALPAETRLAEVNGTSIYSEMRGSGAPMLIIGAADEDAEFFRPIAERLENRCVVTYDRRGTLRSGRDDWPGRGSTQHAEDAAELLKAWGLGRATVFGASAGGIVALRLALENPELVERALIFEPGLFCHVEGGEEMVKSVNGEVEGYLASNPKDWAGAVETLGKGIAARMDMSSPNFFAPPVSREWYAERATSNAEALVREDLGMTMERIAEEELVGCPTPIRFAFGSESLPIFEEIAIKLAAVRGSKADRLDGVTHAVYYSPDVIASYIMTHT